jgi:tetratricopeptide (TPR) repeat protein
MSMFSFRLPAALFFVGAVLVPLSGEGQVTGVDAREKANHLHAVAMTAAGFVDHQDAMPIIARLHAESAALREWDDPHAYDCWRLQAALLHAIGEYDEALAYLENAAAVALAKGAPGLAAHTFLDAASVLDDQGRMDEAQVLIRRAHELIARDELTSAEQRRIERRIMVR